MNTRPSAIRIVLKYMETCGLPRFVIVDGIPKLPAIDGEPGDVLGEVELARFALDQFNGLPTPTAIADALAVLRAIAKEQA